MEHLVIKNKNLKLSTKNKLIGFVFVLPTVLFLIFFFLYPLLYSFFTSFFIYKIGKPLVFNGIQNYINIFKSGIFWYSVYVTFKYAIVSIILEFIGGFIFALSFNNLNKSKLKFLRGFAIVPLVIPTPIMAAIWRYILQPDYGLLNNFLASIGIISKRITYLTTPSIALYTIVIVQTTWCAFIVMFLILAGLQSIKEEYYEAAMIDGANAWQQFLKVTVPLLKPTIIFIVIFRMMDLLQAFTTIFLLAGGIRGGSFQAIDVLSILVYKEAFLKFNFGSAAALSFVIFLIILIFIIIFMRITRGYAESSE
ncbi:MAG: carbohydrate ABC transporter permease [Candidatus Humimicrobiaceae bacterium]